MGAVESVELVVQGRSRRLVSGSTLVLVVPADIASAARSVTLPKAPLDAFRRGQKVTIGYKLRIGARGGVASLVPVPIGKLAPGTKVVLHAPGAVLPLATIYDESTPALRGPARGPHGRRQ